MYNVIGESYFDLKGKVVMALCQWYKKDDEAMAEAFYTLSDIVNKIKPDESQYPNGMDIVDRYIWGSAYAKLAMHYISGHIVQKDYNKAQTYVELASHYDGYKEWGANMLTKFKITLLSGYKYIE